jgi:hypothetical protein
MAINPAFLGHGIWLELRPIKGLRRYANYKKPLPPNPTTAQLVDKFIEAVTDMNMSSVWFELFTRNGEIDKDGKQGTQELVDGLKAAKIAAVPWGYCFGKNSEDPPPDPAHPAPPKPKEQDLDLVKRLCGKYKLDLFCADIEPWNVSPDGTVDVWQMDALKNLVTGLNVYFKKENLGLSSFANLSKQPKASEYLTPHASLFSFCAPQIYWNSRDPIDWAKGSLQSWRDAGITADLVATVQSYWSKGDGTPSQAKMEEKVTKFVTTFPDAEWSKIIAANWYHAGGPNDANEGGMSDQMIKDIRDNKLHLKPYKKP